MRKKHRYYIGIDTGTNTGISVWDRTERRLLSVDCVKIHEAMKLVEGLRYNPDGVFVRVEDARKRGADPTHKNFAKAQGAGSVKRDAGIWEDFLTYLKVDFEMVAPSKKTTKLTAQVFMAITKWPGKTNNHARDAAMLVYNF